MARAENMRRLLAPRSIVFIGGSNLIQPIRNCRKIGYEGEIWVVNPKYDEIDGITCYASLEDLPGIPDAAFVAVRVDVTVEIVRQLALLGCGGCVCYAAGFAEVGGLGHQLQEQLVTAAGEMALVGPNCYGLLNFTNGVALWPDHMGGGRVERGVAIISQSGNVALNMTMHDRSLPITHVISVGNQAVLGVGDYIEPLLEDKRVAAIGLYIEGLKELATFSRAATKALAQGIPLVVLKAGTSEAGAQLTLSHTSSLAGSDDLYQAMFDRLGIIRAPSIAAMLETLKLAAVSGIPAGNRVGALTCSGGDSAMLADALTQQQLVLPPLTEAQVNDLRPLLPSFATVANPLDYNTAIWGNEEALTECFDIMLQGGQDSTLLALDFPRPGSGNAAPWEAATQALIRAHSQNGKITALVSNLPEAIPATVREQLIANGITPLQGLCEATFALGRLTWFGQRRQQALRLQALPALSIRNGAPLEAEPRLLDEWHSKQLLADYGLSLPGGRLVREEEAAEAAAELGFPVVVKVVSDQLAHKTEAGAVALNLNSPQAVTEAIARMRHSVAHQGVTPEWFLVERMVDNAVAELIIGLKRDEQFGLALIIGTGGVLVNLLNDSATLLLPTDRASVSAALHSLQGIKLLQGFRGKPAGDIEAVIDAVLAVAGSLRATSDRLPNWISTHYWFCPEDRGRSQQMPWYA